MLEYLIEKRISTQLGILIILLAAIGHIGLLLWKCPNTTKCVIPADCEGRVRLMCAGEWECVDSQCVWKCLTEE